MEPYLPMEGDPSYREKSKKVLTSTSKVIRIKVHNKSKRKDDDMSPKTQKLNNLQIASVLALAVAAAVGVAHLLGGGVRDIAVAVALVLVLLILALDLRD